MNSPLDQARMKAYMRLLPVLMVCYIIAYVDRNNVSIAKLTMLNDLPAFTNDVIGFGAGIFFFGYFLLEIPGSIIVERWSANKWICRIMVTWGILAAMTAFVKTPIQFYCVRFFLGLAEAGFFPGVIIFLTHWFPRKDRARALALFLIASPIAMIVGPLVSRMMINIGTTQMINGVEVIYPELFGMHGWQLVYIVWGLPAVVMGIMVLFLLPDHPRFANWLTTEQRNALEEELRKEKELQEKKHHMSFKEAVRNPKVILLAMAYFGIVTANYGIEIFLPSIIKQWYDIPIDQIALLAVLPSILVIAGQLTVGWSSDRFKERRWHATIPVVIGAVAIILSPLTQGNLTLTVICFMIAATGMKSYMPAFWALPSMFLTSTAAAGSVGLINSVGNLGGFLGPYIMGNSGNKGGSFEFGLYFIAATSLISACIIATMKMHSETESAD